MREEKERETLHRHDRDPAGFYRVVEGCDKIYSFIALELSGRKKTWGVEIIFKIPYTGQTFSKHLTPQQAKDLSAELTRFAEATEISNGQI